MLGWLLAALLPASVFSQSATSPSPEGLTLRQAFDSALRASEAIAVSEARLRETEALYRQALGASLPQLAVSGESSWQDRRGSNQFGKPDSEVALTLLKTGLSGYRELAAIRGSKHAANERRQLKRRAEQLLLGDVSGAFFGLLLARENVTATQELIKLAEARLTELRERVRVGRSREADAIGQQFQVSSLRSQLEESARQGQARADLLGYLTRSSVTGVKPAQAPFLELPPLERFLKRLEDRPDIVAAREAALAAAAVVRLARADRLPELGLRGNWYAHRPTAQLNNRWDASVTLDVPVWTWGAATAAVEAAKAGLTQEELTLQALRRSAELEVRNAYRDYLSARDQLELRRQALELAKRDHSLQDRDEKRGLVTSLEALESLNRLNGARLAANSALLSVRLASISLDIASGERLDGVEMLQ